MARIDTHVAVWLHARRSSLSPAASEIIESSDMVASPMVRFELDLLHEIGRTAGPATDVLDELRVRVGLTESPIPFDAVVRSARDLSWTRDPFDRLIVADAIAAGDRLVTRDRRIREHFPDAVW